MERLEDKDWVDEALAETIGSEESQVNFEKWRQEHPEAVEMLTSRAGQQEPARSRPLNIRRIIMKSKTTKLAAAALIIIAVLIGINQIGGDRNTVFAQVLEQIEKAKTITWKTTFYAHVTSKDGKRTWIENETVEHAYKAPGLYRNVHFDGNGQISHWTIRDTVNREMLSSINPEERKATFRKLAVSKGNRRGPFVWHHEQMQKYNLEWVGKGETETGEANIFRAAFRDKGNNRDYSYDFWIDAKTKKLVSVHVPGSDIYDPENDPARLNPPHKDWSNKKAIGYIQHDIIYDADLDESLFSLEPPEGYTVETAEPKRRVQVTEKEMVEYLGIMADYNNKTFPDQVSPFIFTTDRINKTWEKAEGERTAAEQKLIETMSYYMERLTVKPTYLFVKDHTVKDSFRYIGKGAKLGDKERIVCWYKLKGSSTYRAVYGDLSIRDVAPEDLPLPVEP